MERAGVWSTRRAMATVLAAALFAAFVIVAGGSAADARGQSRAVAAIPDGFEQQLTYMAQPREVDEPTVVNYDTFKAFQADVWGRDEADIQDFREEAWEFFYERFGLEFSDVAIDEDDGTQTIEGVATLRPSFVAPEREYRAYTIGGMWVPPEGYVVRDASFNVAVEPGTVLFGEYGGADGTEVDGGMVVFGDYNILVPGPGNSGNDEEIDIRFRSGGMIAPNADGVTVFVCDLDSEQWGTGQARGVVTPDGEIRNVLTFPSTS